MKYLLMELLPALMFGGTLFLDTVNADGHCMADGSPCPRGINGQTNYCGWVTKLKSSMYNSLSTDDFVNMSIEMCIDENECNN